jgi:hypothetical protein
MAEFSKTFELWKDTDREQYDEVINYLFHEYPKQNV